MLLAQNYKRMKWTKLPAHKNPLILSQFGVELKLSFRHKQSIFSKSVIKNCLIRAQHRKSELAGDAKNESYWSLDSPFLQEYFNKKGVIVHYGNFTSFAEAKKFAEKEVAIILAELMSVMQGEGKRKTIKKSKEKVSHKKSLVKNELPLHANAR